MSRRWVVVVCLLALSATGCGGADAPVAGPSVEASAERPAAAELCSYLESRLPRLQSSDSQAAAHGNLTGSLHGWYEKRGTAPDGAEIDELTVAGCPDLRAQVLEATGLSSLAAAL